MLRLIGSVTGLALLMVACGGGSDSGPPPPVNSPVLISASPTPPAGVVTSPYGFSFNGEWRLATVHLGYHLWRLAWGTPLTRWHAIGHANRGAFAFTVTATDSAPTRATGSQPFSVTIDTPAPLVITPGQTPPAAVHGTPYGFAFTATGGYLPLSWAITAGTLPPGLTLNPDGTLSGTPTAAGSTPFSFTVTVTDSGTPTRATNSVAYGITISEPPPPTFLDTPPTATVGSPYSFQFVANDGLAPLLWSPPTEPMGGLTLSLDGVLSGIPSTAGIFPITLTVKDALNRSSPVTHVTIRIAMARPEAAFKPTGNMTVAREAHTATLLLDGHVLIAGGGLASAELYDPTNQTFAPTGSMTVARYAHSATLLANSKLPNYGKVLMAGGDDVTAELYDPTTGTFTATGSTLALHAGQSATLLQSGQVLMAGGETASAELFNPSTGTFTATGSLTVSRSGHTATLLPDGRVLIAGGVQDFGPGTLPIVGPGVASAELYDPATGTFTSTGSMSEGRSGHTATLLVDGTVLVTGTDDTAEVFNPGTGTFSVVGELSTGPGATATLRDDGTVLIAGGVHGVSLTTANLFTPESGGFVATGSLTTARYGHTATRLADGTVLITGGTTRWYSCAPYNHRSYYCTAKILMLSSAELFK